MALKKEMVKADGESDEDSSTSAVDQEGGDDDGHETWTEDTQREREEELPKNL